MEKTLFSSVRDGRTSQQIFKQITRAIISGDLKPGMKLPTERELTEQFGASRLIVREALHLLEIIGLITIKGGATGGSFITIPDHSGTADLFRLIIGMGEATLGNLVEARLTIEPTAAKLAAKRADKYDVELMNEAISKMEHALQEKKYYIEPSPQFHLNVVNASKNPILYFTFCSIQELITETSQGMTLTPEIAHDNLKGHIKIRDAILNRDGEEAYLMMTEHINEFANFLIKDDLVTFKKIT